MAKDFKLAMCASLKLETLPACTRRTAHRVARAHASTERNACQHESARVATDMPTDGNACQQPGLITQGVPGVPQDPLAPRRGPLRPSPDRDSAIGSAPALVPGPLGGYTCSCSLSYHPRSRAEARPCPATHRQCSDLLYEVHTSHRWKVLRNHRNGVPWQPLP
jgi:hypothetical protein